MASFQTFFRTVVMLATLGLVAKAWYLYGPSVDEMKTIGARVAEVASAGVDRLLAEAGRQLARGRSARAARRHGAGTVRAAGYADASRFRTCRITRPASTAGAVQLAGGMPAEIVPVSPAGPSTAWPPSSTPEPTRLPPDNTSPPEPTDARLSTLLDRLAQLGVRDQQLSAWGSRGELMRFSCNMPWANSPAYSRHFEAVAADTAGGGRTGGGRNRRLAAGAAITGAGSRSVEFGPALSKSAMSYEQPQFDPAMRFLAESATRLSPSARPYGAQRIGRPRDLVRVGSGATGPTRRFRANDDSPTGRPAGAGWRRCCFWPASRLALRKLAQLANLADATEARTLIGGIAWNLRPEGVCVSGGTACWGVSIATRPKFAPWLRPLVPASEQIRLSPPALETLAVVAYRQPVLRADVEAIRGRGLRGNSSPVDGARPLAYRGAFGRIRAAPVVWNHEAVSGSVRFV